MLTRPGTDMVEMQAWLQGMPEMPGRSFPLANCIEFPVLTSTMRGCVELCPSVISTRSPSSTERMAGGCCSKDGSEWNQVPIMPIRRMSRLTARFVGRTRGLYRDLVSVREMPPHVCRVDHVVQGIAISLWSRVIRGVQRP